MDLSMLEGDPKPAGSRLHEWRGLIIHQLKLVASKDAG
jgi:hypothetical protein